MSKSGKIIGVAAFVLALAAAVLAFFELKQAKAHAGRYAELDKAKRNEHYRAYLLENFDDSEDEYY